jgi:6-pyruvoyl-tetrahydropterin synthase
VFTLTVSDHMLIAHSLRGAVFGPAQRLHGATYVVELTLRAEDLDADGVVADIGRARGLLLAELAELDHRNLDELPTLEGVNTTTEALARHLADRLAARIHDGALGPTARLEGLALTLRESPVAWVTFERPL